MHASNQYNEVNSNITKAMKEAQERWIIEQCNDIEAGMRTSNSKAAFKTLKLLTKSHKTRLTMIEDKTATYLLKKQL